MALGEVEGGASIHDALHENSGVVPEHGTAYEASLALSKETFDSRYKFGFVRNPFDREVSIYASQCISECKWDVSFTEWVKWRYDESAELKVESEEYDYLWNKGFCTRPQVGCFIDPNGKNLMDFIGRYEDISTSWQTIIEALELPKHSVLPQWNVSMREYDYRAYYDTETVDIIADIYQLDLMSFNYEFERGMTSTDINIPDDIKLQLPDKYNFRYRSGGRGAIVPIGA